ncbi:hypothetical protein [Actinomadura rupiterrae]|uniref:hypothetical protein n=1 Tax=Actinomadura rupiterrae TaxID=559627 RepID=UPI0020A61865|nr:hypothetical protein [Actinomadura rupiterrae]MCP2339753.1 uncharacterized protein YbjT (DUF2867 family) [Actinomadura rupiterrae]
MTDVLVLGAGGKTGRRVAARLDELGIAYRSASRRGTPPFDWNVPETWDGALDGVGAVYVVRPELQPADVLEAFVGRAVNRGAGRLVFLSARAGGEDMDRPRERVIHDSGADWTILRPTWYFQNFSEGMFRAGLDSGELRLPAGTGREAFVDTEDIADVAVAALTQAGHEGRTYALSGPRALSFGEAVELIAAASGRPIVYRDIEPDEYARELVAAGESERFAQLQAKLMTWIAEDEGAHLSDGVRQALGREPRGFEDFVKRTNWNPAS